MKKYTDHNIIVHTGEAADRLFQFRSDAKYVNNGAILKVDIDRWREAQFYERKTWMEICLGLSDDRNYEHYQKFDSYKTIMEHSKTNNIKNVIELGCGPFTNLRTIVNNLTGIEQIHLLDPLINDYLYHPGCQYKNKRMFNGLRCLISGFLCYYNIVTHNTPIEECKIETKFDLIIMNNVLEHCYDIEVIFDKIYNMLSENGIFVFGDVYFLSEDIEELSNVLYDSGHPLRLSKDFMDKALEKYTPIFDKSFSTNSEGRHFEKYFIGIKS
jgi:SAM-dependent methyltransferase